MKSVWVVNELGRVTGMLRNGTLQCLKGTNVQ